MWEFRKGIIERLEYLKWILVIDHKKMGIVTIPIVGTVIVDSSSQILI